MQTREVQATVTTEQRANGVTTSSDQRQVTLGLSKVEGPAVEVGVSLGRTVSLGNFEFVRIDVSVRVPCPADDAAANQMFERAVAWAGERLTREVQKVAPTPAPDDSIFR